MKLNDVGILLTPSFRAFAYLQKLVNDSVLPAYALILKGQEEAYLERIAENNHGNFFDKFENFCSTLTRTKIDFDEVFASDCNDQNIVDVLRRRKERYFIYSGGGILKKRILSLGKKFIHVHPGIVPYYRGSTCIYYSILNDDTCGATAFFMAQGIDAGDIIAQKIFDKPNIQDIDYEYDCYIRSELLVDVMKQYAQTGFFPTTPQNLDVGETYYIIHPVLKHLAVLSCS